MAAYQLVLAPAAKADLKEIYLYGVRQWGQKQSESYLPQLKNQLWTITLQPLIGKERTELLANIRSLPVESHILFYRVALNRIEIIRVLHGRQDPVRHLK